jgi:hypothetical protein
MTKDAPTLGSSLPEAGVDSSLFDDLRGGESAERN